MADQSGRIILKKLIPKQTVNEEAAWGTLDLREFIQLGAGTGNLYFRAELEGEAPLPRGLMCTPDGVIKGEPGRDTRGSYHVNVIVVNDEADELDASFELIINPSLSPSITTGPKADLPLPSVKEIIERPITAADVYYLMQRFAALTIWDIYNLDYPGKGRVLSLEGVGKHYFIYDKGCCLVAAPKDLFSHERTLDDGIQAAKALAREAYDRGWVIEFSGFNKLMRAAWVELQLLADKHDKALEIVHYVPSTIDLDIYKIRSKMASATHST